MGVEKEIIRVQEEEPSKVVEYGLVPYGCVQIFYGLIFVRPVKYFFLTVINS